MTLNNRSHIASLSFVLLGILFGCRTSSEKNSDHFEGQITYQIIYKTRDPNFNLATLAQLHGNRMVMTFREGNFTQEYFNAQGRSVRKSIRRVDDSHYYIEFPTLDTTYYTDTRNSGHETTLTLMGTRRILDYPVEEVLSVAIPKADYPHFQRVTTTYFVSDSLSIDPDWYVNYIDGGFDRLAELIPGCMLGIIKKNDLYDMEFYATEIKPGRVDMDAFAVDRDKVFIDALAR